MSDSIGAIAALPVDPAMLAGQAMASSGIALAGPKADPAKIAKAAEDFEAMFAAQMFSPMWEEVGVDETFGGGHGEEVFRTFLTQEYGRLAAQTGSLGIAPHVRDTMLRIQAGEKT